MPAHRCAGIAEPRLLESTQAREMIRELLWLCGGGCAAGASQLVVLKARLPSWACVPLAQVLAFGKVLYQQLVVGEEHLRLLVHL